MIREYYEKISTQKFENLGIIDQFLKKHKLPQLTQNEVDSLNNLITTKKIEFVVIFFTMLQHFFLHRQLADLTPTIFPFSPVSLPLGATTRHSFGQQVTRRNLLGNLPENCSYLNKKAQTQWKPFCPHSLLLCPFVCLLSGMQM